MVWVLDSVIHPYMVIPFLIINILLMQHNLLGCAASEDILDKLIMEHHFLEMVLGSVPDRTQIASSNSR